MPRKPMPKITILRDCFIPRIVEQGGDYQVQLSFWNNSEGRHITGPVRKTMRGAINGWNQFALCLSYGMSWTLQVDADQVEVRHAKRT
jgi:hypothetical protein